MNQSRPRAGVLRQILRDPRGVFGIAWLLIVLLAGVLAPVIAPHDPLAQDLSRALELPSTDYWLGTDSLGRDILSRLMHGGASMMFGILIAIVVALVLGLGSGIVSGYVGSILDAVLTRVTDALLALPGIIIMLLVVAIFGTSIFPAMVALGILLSAQFFRLARAGAQHVRRELFVDAARVAGLSWILIIARHIMPNIIRPIIVQASLSCSMVIFMLSGLSFLGMGPPPPSPQWSAPPRTPSSTWPWPAARWSC